MTETENQGDNWVTLVYLEIAIQMVCMCIINYVDWFDCWNRSDLMDPGKKVRDLVHDDVSNWKQSTVHSIKITNGER